MAYAGEAYAGEDEVAKLDAGVKRLPIDMVECGGKGFWVEVAVNVVDVFKSALGKIDETEGRIFARELEVGMVNLEGELWYRFLSFVPILL